MSWTVEIPLMIRVLIDDLSNTPTYSDERLLQLISVAARYVLLDIQLSVDYSIDITSPQITPDPVVSQDTLFVGLVCLKACCLIDQSSLRTKAALEGITASLGGARLSARGTLAGIQMILKNGPCATYSELTEHWDTAQATYCTAILSPFVGNKFYPQDVYSSAGDYIRNMYS